MKFFVNLVTLEVTQYVATLVDKHNTQHNQRTGHVIVVDRGLQLNLLHPETMAHTGHVDVVVTYSDTVVEGGIKRVVKFSTYDMRTLSLSGNAVDPVFPTGGWSLLETVIALEKYLHKEMHLPMTLQKQILGGL